MIIEGIILFSGATLIKTVWHIVGISIALTFSFTIFNFSRNKKDIQFIKDINKNLIDIIIRFMKNFYFIKKPSFEEFVEELKQLKNKIEKD